MPISTTSRKAGPFPGNGVARDFSFNFKIFAPSELRVSITNAAGAEQVLGFNIDYTVSLNPDQDADAGGIVTLNRPLASGSRLVILSDVALLQPIDLTNQGGFYPDVVNEGFDRATAQIQQLGETIGRAVTVPPSTPEGTDLSLPEPDTGKLLAWGENGLHNLDPDSLITFAAYGDTVVDKFWADGSQTLFTLSADPAAENNLRVSVDGVTQTPGEDFVWEGGTALRFLSAPPNGTRILVQFLRGLAETGGATKADRVPSLTALRSWPMVRPAYLEEEGRSGWFHPVQGDQSANVAADPAQGVWVAPAGQNGSLGAWKRQFDGAANVKWWGAKGDGVTDDWAALWAAFRWVVGRSLYIPAGIYRSSKTIITARGSDIFGDGPDDDNNSVSLNSGYGANLSTIIEFYGVGNGSRWTDIDGVTDKLDFRPGIVLGGPEAKLRLMTVRNIEGGMVSSLDECWDAAVFNPGVGRCQLDRVNTPGRWVNGLYIDATWDRYNTGLRTLHPEVVPAGGPIEMVVHKCWLRGFWGLTVQGTTRDPDAYANNDWIWSRSGNSDLYVEGATISGGEKWFIPHSIRELDGGSYRNNARAKNASRAGQSHTFVGCAFRSGAVNTIRLDHTNNDSFVGCYGEQTESSLNDGIFSVLTTTGKVQLSNDHMKLRLFVDGVQRGSGLMENIGPADLDGTKLSIIRTDGSIITPIAYFPGSESSEATVFTTKSSGGMFSFQRLFGGVRSALAVLTATTFRPATDRLLNLGQTTNRWGTAFVDKLDVRTSPGTLSSQVLNGSGSPESSVSAPPGSVYLDTSNGKAWVKTAGTGATGWQSVTLSGTNGS